VKFATIITIVLTYTITPLPHPIDWESNIFDCHIRLLGEKPKKTSSRPPACRDPKEKRRIPEGGFLFSITVIIFFSIST